MQRAQAGGAVVSTVRYLYKQHNGGMYSTRQRYGPVADRPIGRCEEMDWIDGNAPSIPIKVLSSDAWKIHSTLYGYPCVFMFAAGPFY